MKRKTLLCFALLALVCMTQKVNALNAFAYGLSSELAEDNQTIKIHYSLNADATEVSLVFLNGTSEIKTVPMTDVTAGSYTVDVPVTDLPSNVTLNWKLKVTSPVLTKATVFGTKYSFYHSQGVAVDKDPESPYFGRIYATESYNPSKTGYHSSTNLDGLYVFDAQMQPVKNAANTYGFLGGQTFPAKFADNATTSYAPRKVRVTKDGRVFLTGQNDAGCALWEVNPADLNANFTKVISGTQNDKYEFLVDGKFMAAPNVGFDVKGSGDDLKLLMLSANKSGIAYAYSGYRLDEYNLGKATIWNAEPSKKIDALSGKYTITSTNTSVCYDNEGGIWYCNARSTATDEQPSLVHVNAAGTQDFFNGLGYNRYCGGGIAFNDDFSLLAVADSAKTIAVYKIGKDAESKPTLTKQYVFATAGRNNNDICWGTANNLYVVNSSEETLKAYALPRTSGIEETPAATRFGFKITATGLVGVNSAKAQVITGKGMINVIGNAQQIEVFTVTGILVSKDKANIDCKAGVYLVRVDGAVTKVVVR